MPVVRALVGIVLLVSGAAIPLAAQTDGTYRVPGSIDPKGTTDVTAALQGFLDSVPNGSVIEFPRGARYRVEGTLGLGNRHNLTIEGNGAVVFATTEGDRERSQWTVAGGSRIVFRNLTVRGANPQGGLGDESYQEDLEAQHAFNLLAVDGVELDRVAVSDVYGDFVYIGANRDVTWSQNVWVHDSSFARNGRQGIAVTAGRNVVIERNSIQLTRRSTFDLEPNTQRGGAENIHFLDNVVGQGRLLFLASHGVGPVNDIVVARNQLVGHVLNMDVIPPEGTRRARFWIIGNTSTMASHRTPIRFWYVDGLVLRDNRQPVDRAGETGVNLNEVCGAIVAANNFGAGTPEVRQDGAPCDAAISPDAPPPPPIPGRTERAGPGSERPTVSTAPPTTVATERPPTRGERAAPSVVVDRHGTGPDTRTWVLGAVILVGAAIGGAVAWERLRASRRE